MINIKTQNHDRVCLCDCGVRHIVSGGNLMYGGVKSCGCLKREFDQHGKDKINKKNYADRGIRVCDEWLESFDNFLSDMGERPSKDYSIERIKNNLGYFKSNCRWATRTEQQRNKTNSVFLSLNGQTKSQIEWANELGIYSNLIRLKLKQGATFEEIHAFYSCHKKGDPWYFQKSRFNKAGFKNKISSHTGQHIQEETG